MTLALVDEIDVAGLPPAAPTRPSGVDAITPLHELLGVEEHQESGVMLRAQALADAHPASPVALIRLAQAAQAAGDQDRACSAARSALAAAGDAPTGSAQYAAHAAALVLAAHDAPDAADALAHDTMPGASVIRASLAVDAGRRAEALAGLADATGALALSMRGWLLLDTEPTKAVAALRAAAREGLRSADVLVNLGYGLNALGARRKAIRVTREATRLSPHDLHAAYNLAIYLHREGENPEALAEMDRIADLRPADADLALRRAWAHVHLGQNLRAALRHLKQDRDRLRFSAPSEMVAHIEASIAFLSFRLGQRSLDAARSSVWQQLIPSGPGPEVVKMLASLITEAQDAGELQRLLVSAGHVLADGELLGQQARLAVLEDRMLDAVALARQSVAAAPNNPDLLAYAMYVAGEHAGDYAAAAAMFGASQAADAYEPTLANNIALVLALAGDPQSAAQVIARAGGSTALPFFGATAALVDLAAGRVDAGLRGYEEVVRRYEEAGDEELASLVNWRRQLAMLQLGLPLAQAEKSTEPAGTGHATTRVLMRKIQNRLLPEGR
jgi:tetratricopeptide (TPR) repeat protein